MKVQECKSILRVKRKRCLITAEVWTDSDINVWLDYWDGKDVKPITDDVRKEIMEKWIQLDERSDLDCFCVSYKPIEKKYEAFIIRESKTANIVHIDARQKTFVDVSQIDLSDPSKLNEKRMFFSVCQI